MDVTINGRKFTVLLEPDGQKSHWLKIDEKRLAAGGASFGDTARFEMKRELKHLYQASVKQVTQVDVPAMRFLMIDGEGDPNTSQRYAEAVEALFSVSYTAKFMLKKGPQALDYAVMPLEGLWWSAEMSAFKANDRAKWQWTMMIMQPDFIAASVIETVMEEVKRKKALPAIDALRLETFTEGCAARSFMSGPSVTKGRPFSECMSSSPSVQVCAGNITRRI